MKPTLLQTLLGQPSQRYSIPDTTNYYSHKPALIRAAAQTAGTNNRHSRAHSYDAPPGTVSSPSDGEISDEDDVFFPPRQSSESHMSLTLTQPVAPIPMRAATTYTDKDWENEFHWLAHKIQKPRKTIPIIPAAAPRTSRSSTPSIMMSMTTLLEEDENATSKLELPVSPPPSAVLVPEASESTSNSSRSNPRSSQPTTRSHTSSRRLSPITSKSSDSSHGHHGTPSVCAPPPSGPPELPSYGTPAYTSLIVPTAPPSSQPIPHSTPIARRLRNSMRLSSAPADLSRSRPTNPTMASIEVVSGLAGSQSHSSRLGFTHYRTPPSVPKSGILVQVWAVGLDAVDLRLLGTHTTSSATARSRTQSLGRLVGRSMSISRRSSSESDAAVSGSIKEFRSSLASLKSFSSSVEKVADPPSTGFIPGRAFVGRVLECGWDVSDDVRRGEWVVGLMDVKKSGALAEFIIVDRHRIQRVPQPSMLSPSPSPPSLPPRSHSPIDVFPIRDSPYPVSRPLSMVQRSRATPPASPPSLSLEELALLPLGLSAYRAIGTLGSAWCECSVANCAPQQTTPEGEIADPFPSSERRDKKLGKRRRRVLVINGHSGVGGLITKMLTKSGWRVCVHAPGPDSSGDDSYMADVQSRTRGWGVEEVVFDDGEDYMSPKHSRRASVETYSSYVSQTTCGSDTHSVRSATVRAIERLVADGDEFDAVVDTIGGRDIWAAGAQLLLSGSTGGGKKMKQFTTIVGDHPGRVIPSAKDYWRAGMRSRKGVDVETKNAKKTRVEIGYAFVSPVQDVDWSGEDVRDGLAALVKMAFEGTRLAEDNPTVPFERAVDVLEGRSSGLPAAQSMRHGGTVVVKVTG